MRVRTRGRNEIKRNITGSGAHGPGEWAYRKCITGRVVTNVE